MSNLPPLAIGTLQFASAAQPPACDRVQPGFELSHRKHQPPCSQLHPVVEWSAWEIGPLKLFQPALCSRVDCSNLPMQAHASDCLQAHEYWIVPAVRSFQ